MIYVYDFCMLSLLTVIMTVGNATMWTIFEKAAKPGWAALVPIYNSVVFIQIAGKPVWWIVFFLIAGIPCLNLVALVFMIMLVIEFAKRFGKGGGFIAGLILLPIIFYPMLAFGKSEYTPPEPAGA